MRKLSMKGKRGKSETSSDVDSEENGVSVKPVPDDASSEHDASKIQKKTKKGRRSQVELNKQTDVTEDSTNEQENGSPGKKRKKDGQKASTSEKPEKPDDEEYEVLKVVGQRTIKGRRQFLVRWKGYDEDSDTWEQEKNLNCPQLIEEYLAELAESGNTEKLPKTPRIPKERKGVAKAKTPRTVNKKRLATEVEAKDSEHENEDEREGENVEETKEFEVQNILEVKFQKKTNKREFLIRWKGFSPAEDTWEPEENLNCPELISKFMDKVEGARKTELRELRTNPAHTKRYTLMSTEPGRRLSRRNINKQRRVVPVDLEDKDGARDGSVLSPGITLIKKQSFM